MLGKSMFQIKMCDSAAINLEMVASKIDSLADEANLMLALCNYENREYSMAIPKFEVLYSKGKLSAIDQHRLGQSYFMTTDSLKAFEVWTKLAKDSTTYSSSCKLMSNMVKLMTKMQLRTRAIEMGELWLSNATCELNDKANVLFIMGNNYINLASDNESDPILKADYATKSINVLKESSQLDPTNIYTYLYIGDAYVKLDSVPKGLGYYQMAINRAKEDTLKNSKQLLASYNKICGSYLTTKKYTELVKLAQEWTVDQPKVEWGWFYLAVAYQNLQNADNAIKYYKKVLAINPNNQTARKQISALNSSDE
jgi:tetratricopeptide (TPR) repeat protein